MRAHEITEYSVEPVASNYVSDKLASGDALRAKQVLKPVKTPITEFEVMYYRESQAINRYYFFGKSGPDSGMCVGEFVLETRVPGPQLATVVAPGITMVTPHITLDPEYQRAGIASKCYLTFLNGGPWVYVTTKHTADAGRLWDRLAAQGNISFYYSPSTGITQNGPAGVRFLGPKERFNLGTAT
jgi:hypothetical protein